MSYHYYSDNQFMFDRVLYGLWTAAKWLLKAIIYLPLWFTGYIITFQLLTKKDSPLLWIGSILLFAFALYQLLFFIKGITIALKERGNLAWIPLFLICTAFTSVLPAWISYDTFHSFAEKLTKESSNLVAWIFSISFGLYIYSRYHFLSNIAPRLAFAVYQLGIDIGLRLFQSMSNLTGKRSAQIF